MTNDNALSGLPPDLSRRRVLGAAAASMGIAPNVATAQSGPVDVEDRVSGPDFEEREWGYVRSDFEPPEPDSATPAVLAMDGYGRSEPPSHYLRMRDGVYVAVKMDEAGLVRGERLRDDYQTVSASVRGTGCSGGKFDLFDRHHARDGREIIEWLADREWSLDRVGLLGGSYSGMTAFLIASTRPPSLGAMSASMVVGDLFRGIAYPGGVPNSGFPALWTGGLRPALDAEGTASGVTAGDPICAQNAAQREPTNPCDQDTTQLYSRRREDLMYYSRQVLSYAERVEVPTYIGHAWQDEQSGPRGGPEVFQAISPPAASPPGLDAARHRHEDPTLFRGTNGYHADASDVAAAEARKWFDYWLGGEETGIMNGPQVELHVNTGTDAHGTLGYADYPAPSADWTRFYFDGDGDLVTSCPEAASSATYVTGSPRKSWVFDQNPLNDVESPVGQVNDAVSPVTEAEGPDVVTYRSPSFDEPTVVAGPMAAELYVETTTTDADLFVSVYDQYPDGSATPIQRGLLRASHRSLDEARSLYTDEGDLFRPFHPHTNPEPVTPGEVTRYDVEVFPLGQVFYPGHRLVVRVHSPPLTDGLWSYEPIDGKGRNTLHHGPEHPSNIIVRLADASDRDVPPEPACGAPLGYRCVEF
jgi:putative CocE/NonD family hydrolase